LLPVLVGPSTRLAKRKFLRPLDHEERGVFSPLGVAAVAELPDVLAVADEQHRVVAFVLGSEAVDALGAAQLAGHLLRAELVEAQRPAAPWMSRRARASRKL
jgi:hypothetical protein